MSERHVSNALQSSNSNHGDFRKVSRKSAYSFVVRSLAVAPQGRFPLSPSPPLSSPPSALCRLSLWEWCLVCVGAQAAKAGDQARTYALHAPHPPTQGHAAPPPHAGRGVHPASPARHSSRGPRFAPPATACAARAPAPAASCPWRLPGCAGGAAGGRGSGLAPAAGAVRRAAAAGGALDPCWLGREGA